MRRIDLHTHSRFSDGTCEPAKVVRLAHGRGVELMALSDHDSVSGFPEALAQARALGVGLVCGVEINTREDDKVHILGYGVDAGSPALARRLEEFRRRRQERLVLMLERLRACGVEVDLEEVRGVSREAVGRPHIADALRRRRLVKSRQEAFERYLSPGCPGYVEPMGPSVEEAIAAIREAGGLASLAHPGSFRDMSRLRAWKGMGLEGLEAYYLSHTRALTLRLLDYAKGLGLLPTGGSDYHGPGTGRTRIGGVEVPDALYERLREALPCA